MECLLLLTLFFYQVDKYVKKLDAVLLKNEEGIPIVPELYAVPKDLVIVLFNSLFYIIYIGMFAFIVVPQRKNRVFS